MSPVLGFNSFRPLAVLCAALLASAVNAQELISASRLVTWTPGVTVGVTGGVDQKVAARTRLIDVTQAPYNADATGANDATTAIQSAIQAAQSGDVVFLPAGTYRVTRELTLKSNMTLRGAGPERTTIMAYGAIDVIKVSMYSSTFWDQSNNPTVTSATTRGTNVLTVSNTSDFQVGWMAQITHAAASDQYDPDLELSVWGNVSGHGWLRRQKVKIVAKTATTLTISPGIYGDLTRAVRIAPAQYHATSIGVEDLALNMENSTSYAGITLGGVLQGWIKNVKVWGAKNYNVVISDCLQSELRDSHIDVLNHVGSSGSGLLMLNSSGTLVENNIFKGANSCIQVDHGSSGNVFGYNLVLNTAGSIAINGNHGPHNAFNLYEGNIATSYICDGYHGSASNDTLFRNWITGIDTAGVGIKTVGWTIALKRFTRNYSIIGNIIGAPGYKMDNDSVSLGQPNMGNSSSSGTAPAWADWGKYPGASGYQELDTGVASTLTRKANYNYQNGAIPSAERVEESQLVSSMYRTERPSWFGTLPWPAINPFNPTAVTMESIPAGRRYVKGPEAPGEGPTPIPTQQQRPINVRVSSSN